MQEYVNVITNGALTTIEFFHPAQNSMPGEQLVRLRQAVLTAGQDENTSVIVLKSGGDRSFCAGASFTELASIRDLENSRKFFMGFASIPIIHKFFFSLVIMLINDIKVDIAFKILHTFSNF